MPASFRVNLQCVLAVRVDHRLGAGSMGALKQFIEQLARENHRVAAFTPMARDDNRVRRLGQSAGA